MLRSLPSAPLLFFFIYLVSDASYLQFKFDLYVIKPTKVTSSNCLTTRVGDMPSKQNGVGNALRPLSCMGHTYRDYLLVFNVQSTGMATSRQTSREHCSDSKVYHPYSSYTQLSGISFMSFAVLK